MVRSLFCRFLYDGPGFNNDYIKEQIRKVTGPIESYDRTFGPGIRIAEIHRNVSFDENTLGRREGVNNIRIIASRFVVIPHFRRTDEEGRFTSSLRKYHFVAVNCVFQNEALTIRSFVWGRQTVAGTAWGILSSALSVNTPAMHIRLVNPTNNVNNTSINFSHGSKQALWSITNNAIQEANRNTINLNMRSGVQTQFLNVMCHYHHNTANAGYAAPMLARIGSYPEGHNILLNKLNLASFIGQTIAGLLPDVIIGGGDDNPLSTNDLRQTIYHEYGHTLHYFKANPVNNNHWKTNIGFSIGSGYGDNINTARGAFFSLSEGWADYIGHTYAFIKYGTNLNTVTETNAWTFQTVTTHYQGLLEDVPTFYNSFIPRGLFFDLTDGGNNEDFDRIQGFTTNDIYQILSPTVITIQQFRTDWENQHPNVNNALLFEEYLNP